ncbi:two component system sensor histidine kinase, hybrid [Desulfobacula toluolica Tol2]|uniref:histidine kinase n=2 Tax=Desulfobacula toluolica TaxID=28223 RepID=K0N553_DESTT|nr:two component system sensor histidine kinase, hybrid [Desulfobacula toluolica Tol2]
MLRELNDSSVSLTCSLLLEYDQSVISGELTLQDAQSRAKKRIRNLRYGPEDQDYFWIIDMQHRVLMHPFLPDIEEKNCKDFVDSNGRYFVAEFVKTAEQKGSGYVEYTWQWKDDSAKIVPKISYVKLFEPWGWVIGTAVYVDGIDSEIRFITQRLFKIFTGILIIVLILSFYGSSQAVKIDKKRSIAEKAHRLDTLRFEKLRELNQMAEASLEELIGFALAEAIELTFSSIGYLVFLNDDEIGISLYTWSKGVLEECRIKDKESLYYEEQKKGCKEAVRQRKAVIINEVQNLGYDKGKELADGHVNIIRYMHVPVFDGKKIVAVAGVGNKIENYDMSDVRQLNLLMDGMWKMIQRKRSEVALRESEQRYRLLTENASDNIWTLCLSDMRILYVSPSVENILGYTPEQIKELQFKDYMTEDSLNKMFMVVAEELKKEEQPGADPKRSRVIQLEQIKKDGSKIWTEITASFLRDEAGKAYGIIGVTRDINERRYMERQIQQSQKMEAIGTLAGGIAHDFNNILSSVLGFTELAKMMCDGNPELEKHLDKVFSAGIRARDLVKHILVFSREQDVHRDSILIVPLIKECLKFIRASVPRSIDIIQDLHASDCTVLADPTQIHQVIMNLCINAAHSMKGEDGLLEVCLKAVEIRNRDILHAKELKPGKYLKLTVSDSGCGIPKSDIGRIFEPFFTTKKRGDGTGMGLSIVHGIVKDMGGAISVYSELGKGTTFQLLFPVHRDKAMEKISLRPFLIKGTGRILLVDDEENIVISGRQILMKMGYEVVGLTDSLEALEVFKKEPHAFDLVLTDVTMPKMTGIELSKEIIKIRQDIPIVLCTGFSEGLTSSMVENIGIVDTVMKPMIAGELADVIHKALNRFTGFKTNNKNEQGRDHK